MFNKRLKGDRIVRTVSQACDVDLVEIHCGCHRNIKGALGNVISTVGHSNSKRTLRQKREEADGCDHTNYYVGKGGQTNADLRQEHTGPTVGRLKRLERLGRGREQICLVCSAASEAFGAARTLLDPTEHAKSEEEGRRTSVPLDSFIIVCHLNGHSDWWCASESALCVGGAEYWVRFVFLCTPFRHSPFSRFAVLVPD